MKTDKFKAGDKVYYPLMTNKIVTLTEPCELSSQKQNHLGFVIDGKDYVISQDGTSIEYIELNPSIFYATKENHKLLSELYGKEFEEPLKSLEGSELVKTMCCNKQDVELICCWISRKDDQAARNDRLPKFIEFYDFKRCYPFVDSDGVSWKYAVPFDPKTGKELTEDILDETI